MTRNYNLLAPSRSWIDCVMVVLAEGLIKEEGVGRPLALYAPFNRKISTIPIVFLPPTVYSCYYLPPSHPCLFQLSFPLAPRLSCK